MPGYGRSMRAVVLSGLSGPGALTLTNVPAPSADGQVVVNVVAAGVCFPDLLVTYGKYQHRPRPPVILGTEVAGVVASAPVGCGFEVGQRVIAATEVGGYAEQVGVHPNRILPVPDGLSLERAASLVLNYNTSEFALSWRARVQPGETVVVLGAAGGMGMAAVQLATDMGARVIAVVRRMGAADLLRSLGADEVVKRAPGWGDQVREVAPKGVDVIVDPVGGDSFSEAMRVLAPEGRLLLIGFASGVIPPIQANNVLFRNVSVLGVAWGEYVRTHREAFLDVYESLLRRIDAGLEPIVTARYPLERAADALIDLETGRIVGKGIILVH